MKADVARTAWAGLLLLVLTACGQTGALVLPGAQPPSEQSNAAAEDESGEDEDETVQ